MTLPTQDRSGREHPEGHPDGMLDHCARMAVRDLTRRYGFEEARQRLAEYLNDECERRVRQ